MEYIYIGWLSHFAQLRSTLHKLDLSAYEANIFKRFETQSFVVGSSGPVSVIIWVGTIIHVHADGTFFVASNARVLSVLDENLP